MLGTAADAIALYGGSHAGLAALVAAGSAGMSHLEGDGGNEGVSSEVAAVASFSAPVVLSSWGVPLIVGAGATQERIDEASPLRYAHHGFPATMLVHGTADTTIACSESERMFQALRQFDVPVELHLYAGEQHSFQHQPPHINHTAELISHFATRHASRT
jgi:dipeptidyl aminopeptidase/acylaminoacyl peptidase